MILCCKYQWLSLYVKGLITGNSKKKVFLGNKVPRSITVSVLVTTVCPDLNRISRKLRDMLESPLHGWTLAACLVFQTGSHSAIIPMISIQSYWNPLENSGLTSDKQNQQEPKEGVRLLSRGTEVFQFSESWLNKTVTPCPPNNGQVHLHYHESLESNLREWLAAEHVNSFSSINTWHQAGYLKPRTALSQRQTLDPQKPILRSWNPHVALSILDNTQCQAHLSTVFR